MVKINQNRSGGGGRITVAFGRNWYKRRALWIFFVEYLPKLFSGSGAGEKWYQSQQGEMESKGKGEQEKAGGHRGSQKSHRKAFHQL